MSIQRIAGAVKLVSALAITGIALGFGITGAAQALESGTFMIFLTLGAMILSVMLVTTKAIGYKLGSSNPLISTLNFFALFLGIFVNQWAITEPELYVSVAFLALALGLINALSKVVVQLKPTPAAIQA